MNTWGSTCPPLSPGLALVWHLSFSAPSPQASPQPRVVPSARWWAAQQAGDPNLRAFCCFSLIFLCPGLGLHPQGVSPLRCGACGPVPQGCPCPSFSFVFSKHVFLMHLLHEQLISLTTSGQRCHGLPRQAEVLGCSVSRAWWWAARDLLHTGPLVPTPCHLDSVEI